MRQSAEVCAKVSPCKLFFSVFLDVIIIFIDGAHLGAMAHSIPRKMARRKSKDGRGGDGGGGGGEDARIGSAPKRKGALDATKDGNAEGRKQEAEDVKMARVVDVVVGGGDRGGGGCGEYGRIGRSYVAGADGSDVGGDDVGLAMVVLVQTFDSSASLRL